MLALVLPEWLWRDVNSILSNTWMPRGAARSFRFGKKNGTLIVERW